MIKSETMTRRLFFGAGSFGVAAAFGVISPDAAGATPELNRANEAAARKYYKLWETDDWAPMDRLLASTFTFTSAAGDDHISKSDFKKGCWDTQIGNTRGFDLLHVVGSGSSVFVLYIGHTKNNRSFRNAEFLQVRDGQITSIECYFGQQNSFPSAVSAEK
jgi:ketosteroid isomerase-like protein